MPALVCVVLLTSTVPTVAPVSPFTPVIDVTVAVCGLPVIGHVVRRDHDRRVRLVDRQSVIVVLRDVVVVGGAGEAPGVAGIRAGVGVRRVAHVDRADRRARLAVHAGDRCDRRRVRHCRHRSTLYGVTTTVAFALSMSSVIVVLRDVVVVGRAREAPVVG